jgi:UDP-N-acetylglucosamine 4,6-dehydratase
MLKDHIKIFKNKTILITGGTGSFGSFFIQKLLNFKVLKKIIVYSRDELKQYELQNRLIDPKSILRFFIGDVRDKERLLFATKNVDYIVHAAALKQVPAAEYNPFECIKTNVLGAQNIVDAAIENKVKRILALSTDKAALPINLYGASKLVSDKLITAANNIVGKEDIKFSVVRYGNVLNSRGSLVPFLLKIKKAGEKVFPLTHPDMTRFWITLDQATNFVLGSFNLMKGGEIFVPKIPSIKIVNLMKAIDPRVKFKNIGIRPGEKIHELMCPADSAYNTIEFKKFFIISPSTFESGQNISSYMNYFGEKGKKVKEGFEYRSDTNKHFLKSEEIKKLLKK